MTHLNPTGNFLFDIFKLRDLCDELQENGALFFVELKLLNFYPKLGNSYLNL